MIHADEDLVDLLQDFFDREVTPDLVAEVERSGEWPADLWGRAAKVEIPSIGVAEAAGGVGGTAADVAALLHHAARTCAPLPLLEHHLASHLLATTGGDLGDGLLVLVGLGPDEVPAVVDGTLTGRLERVAWAGAAESVVVLTSDEAGRDVVAVLDPATATHEPHLDIAGTPVPTLLLDAAAVRVAPLEDRAAFVRYAQVLHCSAMAGLLERLDTLTAAYVSERHQFGKPVGAFQAVQIHTVTLAQAATAARLAVDRAVSAVASGGGELEVAAAAVVVGEHAVKAAAAAHQAHGAIGMTREYPLQQVTRRLQTWRQAHGSLDAVQETVGRRVLDGTALSRVVARHPEEGSHPA